MLEDFYRAADVLEPLAEQWRERMDLPCLRCGHVYMGHREGGRCVLGMDGDKWGCHNNGQRCRCIRFAFSWVDQTPMEGWR